MEMQQNAQPPASHRIKRLGTHTRTLDHGRPDASTPAETQGQASSIINLCIPVE